VKAAALDREREFRRERPQRQVSDEGRDERRERNPDHDPDRHVDEVFA
jgi:hypothetical protein